MELPPLPKGMKILKPMEAEHLKNSGVKVPKSPKECPTCKGNGTFRWYSTEQGHKSEVVDWKCNCVDQWIMHRYFLAHGISPRYQKLGLRDATAVDRGALMQVLLYLENADDNLENGRGLYLYGPNGTGKTMLGTIVLKMMMARGHTGYWTTFIDLIEGKKAGFDDQDSKDWFVRQIRNSDFLLIDDPGKEYHGGEQQINFKTSLLDEVVRHRNGMQLPTIITANYSPEVFQQRYGQSISSLLTEGATHVRFDGQDYRRIADQMNLDIQQQGLSRPVVVS